MMIVSEKDFDGSGQLAERCSFAVRRSSRRFVDDIIVYAHGIVRTECGKATILRISGWLSDDGCRVAGLANAHCKRKGLS